MRIQQKITPFLSYNTQAVEAAAFYTSLIPDSRIVRTVMNPANGAALLVEFELAGLSMIALNVGQDWKFTEAFSLSVACDTQDEIDRLWAALTEGGKEIQCGWLVDRFGVSWQIVPANIAELVGDPDPQRSGRVMQALLSMIKLDMAALQAAYDSDGAV